MMINPVSILPNVIDSSTAEKKKQRDNRHLPKKTSHQSEENPSPTESSPYSKASGEGFEEQGQMSNNAFKGTGKEGMASRISHSSNEKERTPVIDITV